MGRKSQISPLLFPFSACIKLSGKYCRQPSQMWSRKHEWKCSLSCELVTAADRFQSFSAEAFTRISCDFPLQHATSAFTSIVFSPQPNPSSKQTFPKKWEAREESKQTEMQRQKTAIGSIGSQWDSNSADNNGFLQEFGPSQSDESLWGEERWNDDVHSSGKVGKVLSHQTGKSMWSKII